MRALSAFVLLFSVSALAAATSGKITKLQGDVKLADGKVLAQDAVVIEGDEIHTGARSFVRVKLDDGVVLQAGANSALKVMKKKAEEPTTVQVLRGNVLSVIKPSAGREVYRVKTPNAVMGVRGTTFFVEETPAKPTHLCVCEGGVAVRSGKDQKEKIFQTTTHTPMGISASGIGAAPESKTHDLHLAEELRKEL